MKEVFDKTFFKLAAGFAGILTVAIVSILVVGYYETERSNGISSSPEASVVE